MENPQKECVYMSFREVRIKKDVKVSKLNIIIVKSCCVFNESLFSVTKKHRNKALKKNILKSVTIFTTNF